MNSKACRGGAKTGLPSCIAVKTFSAPAVQLRRELNILTRCQHHVAITSFMAIFCLPEGRWVMATELERGTSEMTLITFMSLIYIN